MRVKDTHKVLNDDLEVIEAFKAGMSSTIQEEESNLFPLMETCVRHKLYKNIFDNMLKEFLEYLKEDGMAYCLERSKCAGININSAAYAYGKAIMHTAIRSFLLNNESYEDCIIPIKKVEGDK